jgi:hypothetical protein
VLPLVFRVELIPTSILNLKRRIHVSKFLFFKTKKFFLWNSSPRKRAYEMKSILTLTCTSRVHFVITKSKRKKKSKNVSFSNLPFYVQIKHVLNNNVNNGVLVFEVLWNAKMSERLYVNSKYEKQKEKFS